MDFHTEGADEAHPAGQLMVVVGVDDKVDTDEYVEEPRAVADEGSEDLSSARDAGDDDERSLWGDADKKPGKADDNE